MSITEKFEKIGARAKMHNGNVNNRFRQMASGNVRLNVLSDKEGEYFDIAVLGNDSPEISVLDVQPKDRHLLLLTKGSQGDKSKFLCGHDERHWFVAAIPESAPVGTVRQAKEALKPKEVRDRQIGLSKEKKNKRKNSAYIRQGEFFFLKTGLNPDKMLILKNEPITRGNGSKPHMAEYCYRTGGQTVYVCSRYPNGVNQLIYNKLLQSDKNAGSYGWRVMTKDAKVYVKGKIRHSDHATITLNDWHLVEINTENKAAAMRHVAFLD